MKVKLESLFKFITPKLRICLKFQIISFDPKDIINNNKHRHTVENVRRLADGYVATGII